MAKHNDLGKKGEELAATILLQKGYTILETNWRYRKAEIDILAQKNNILVVVEVKTRSSSYYGDPQNFINSKKVQLLIKAVNQYINRKNLNLEVRFDIIAVIKSQEKLEIEHLENAFYHF